MTLRVRESLGNVSDEEVRRYESELKISFPEIYRKFLLQYNGGVPEPALFTVSRWGKTLVNRFFGISKNDPDDFIIRNAAVRRRLPGNSFAIADDPGGNTIILIYDGPNKGKIYFWDHEEESGPTGEDASRFPNVHYLADGLKELLDSLEQASD
jgi:hypothetical protein